MDIANPGPRDVAMAVMHPPAKDIRYQAFTFHRDDGGPLQLLLCIFIPSNTVPEKFVRREEVVVRWITSMFMIPVSRSMGCKWGSSSVHLNRSVARCALGCAQGRPGCQNQLTLRVANQLLLELSRRVFPPDSCVTRSLGCY